MYLNIKFLRLYLLNVFLVQVITITPINGDGNPTNGCSSAAMVRVAKATSAAKDISGGSAGNIVSTHPTSKTQAIITAEDTSSPGNVTAKVCSYFCRSYSFDSQV